MPLKVKNSYAWSGVVEVSIFTEHEMAAVLELTVDALRTAIQNGEYSYHIHPDAQGSGTPGKYQFTERVYRSNIDRKVERDRRERGESARDLDS